MAAVCGLCLSCIETNYKIGNELLPPSQQYDFYTVELPIEEINMRSAAGLSGFSSTRITVGAIKDEDFGVSTRSSVVTLVPMIMDSLEIGEEPIFKSFRFAAALDTTSFKNKEDAVVLQMLNAYELKEAMDKKKNYDCSSIIEHKDERVNNNSIVYNGLDSLTFNFSKEYGDKFLGLKKEDFKSYDTFISKFPGIVLEAEAPSTNSGRINMFELQLGFDNQNGLTGNFAILNYSAKFKGVRKDTSVYFYYGATKFNKIDSLLKYSGKGSFPQYCLNTSTQQSSGLEGLAEDLILIEGGGGLKPCISATYLKEIVENEIASKGGDPRKAVINKATINLPFEFPSDYTEMDIWPQILSPTCRIEDKDKDGKTKISYAGLADASSEHENQGDIDRSNLLFRPDVTYHLQSIIRIDPKKTDALTTKRLYNGSYDTWFLIMANEEVTTTSSSSAEMSEYYNYLAYQSYYNSMYGGYGGYGYGGYGGGYGYNDYYSNYYSYAMLAAAANQSSTTKSYSVQLDKDRYYCAALNGPGHSSKRVPTIKFTYGIPKE